MYLNKFSWISVWFFTAVIIVVPYSARSFDNLGREETLDFCVRELGKRIGAENALKMEDHCGCAADLALKRTPDSLKTPLARLVRHQGLRPEDRAALKAESGNLFLYIAMLDSHCPKILSDPQLQKLLLPSQ
ncbi:hypothetical protein WH96_10145 [Kiloniella spongiae]|uniref:Uncharacterized protein n=1 Tax=Kiloniella spongiae TaxID=1489064 RepID=A0A0H2MVS6_9PROT|nr:hypothetical protein [Kiloniella spongiae]KLN60820.1 hypothetical protein WH96_10145 [Kiloniella spongiae]